MFKRRTVLWLLILVATASVNVSDAVSTEGPLDSCMRASLVVGIMGMLGYMLDKQIGQEDI